MDAQVNSLTFNYKAEKATTSTRSSKKRKTVDLLTLGKGRGRVDLWEVRQTKSRNGIEGLTQWGWGGGEKLTESSCPVRIQGGTPDSYGKRGTVVFQGKSRRFVEALGKPRES